MRRTAVVVALAALLVLPSCAPSSAEFSDDAEDFLRSDEVFRTYGLDLPEPDCAEPSSTDPGTTFSCTATAQDGTTYQFSFEVTGRTDVALQSIDFADP